MHSKKIGKIFASVLAATLASTSALAVSADKTAVVIGGYATDGLKVRLETAGYAVTLAAQPTGVLSSLGDFDQVWDLRFMDALSVEDNGAYLSYLQNAGGLFLIGEHAGFADRNNSLVSFITAAGGGDVTYAPNSIETQYVTSPFNGDAVVVADSSTPVIVPSAGTVATPGNGVFITTSGPDGTGVGTGVAFGAGSLTNALDGRLLTYFDVDTFSSGTINNNAAVRALVDRMISFVAGDFQADPDLGGSGIIDTSKGEFTLADAAAQGEAVTFDGGTLSMTGGASPDVILSNPIAIQDGGAFINTAGVASTLSGVISGDGGLIVQGQGTLVLTGANNYAGGTVIAGDSTVRVSDGGALGIGGLNLMGGTLAAGADFALGTNIQLAGGVANAIDTAGHDVVLNGAVSGAGGLIVQGGGTLTLAGANNHAGGVGITGDSTVRVSDGGALGGGALVLSGGTLAADAGFATGANVQLLNATGNLIDTNGHTVELTGAISGAGGLIKTGDGRLNLTGVNDYSGDTQVNGGRLAMNGTAVNSSFTVNAGGSIGGNGTVGALVVSNGATAAPGNSIGQLTAATTVLFEAGSTYEVEIDATGASDRLVASETVTIDGGTVQVLAAAGDYAPRTSYAIIVAGDGVTGTFDAVTSDLAFLTPALIYASNGVVLTMTRNDVRFADVGVTFNQRSTAAAVDGAFNATSALYNELVGMNAAEARRAFDALSGEAHASALSFAAADADNVRRTLIGRFDGPAGTGTEMWTTVTGSWNDIDGNGNSAAVSGNGQGFLAGVETDLASFRVGVAGGYTDGDARIRARGAQADVRNLHVGVYGGGAFGKLRVRAGAVHTAIDVRADRQVNVVALSETLKAKYDGQAAQAFAELGYAMPLGNGMIEPFAGINALWLKNEAFTETGGTLALEGAERTRDTIWSNLGFKASFALGANSPLTAQVKGVWQHALTDRATDSRLAFANGGPSFLVHGAPLARDAAAVDASLRWQVADRVQVGVGYAGTIADQGESQSVRLTLGVRL
ncbi:autotransporter outer membrane beta-barrel domain-containing protein [Sphingomonas sp. KC8]|uniref:autotransporter outer membrane beta-barrel domain-containing protein n=1 Tax=Sphingomonas sp. KC8 TaxID=1030157 RepID=UPI00024897A7|nr:autotransporter domain-containing protein [Sphingomonas sp. KC8]ARS28896.1 hypothetical protein KC8_16635 [Sphingomonas sp. KC8]